MFKNRVREVREGKALSQSRLARLVGVAEPTLSQVENSVREALIKYEPRIDLLGVKASANRSDQGQLLVSIDYEIRASNTRSNMVYPFYLKEG